MPFTIGAKVSELQSISQNIDEAGDTFSRETVVFADAAGFTISPITVSFTDAAVDTFSIIIIFFAEAYAYVKVFKQLSHSILPARFGLSVTLLSLQLICTSANAQDSSVVFDDKAVTLKEVIVRSNLNVAKFIERVQEDSSFYKAFKNLHILGYTALNDIRMMGKNSKTIATLNSRTRQQVKDGCRWMETLGESTTGDIYTKKKEWNYYTAEMYAGLFFTRDTICGDNNIVGNAVISKKGKSGIQKHKEQLKMLFFNPGKKIPGIPFIGDKIAIFEGDAANRYDFIIDMQPRNQEMCYVFTVTPRKDLKTSEKDQIVINEMTTWFRISSWEIVARNYNLSYRAGVYDFDVDLQVELGQFGELLVPKVLHYRGNWDVVLKKRERCFFTATLFDFTK